MARQERKTVTLYLAPEDKQRLVAFCEAQGRSYGEFLALLLREQELRSQFENKPVMAGA